MFAHPYALTFISAGFMIMVVVTYYVEKWWSDQQARNLEREADEVIKDVTAKEEVVQAQPTPEPTPEQKPKTIWDRLDE